MHSLFSTHGLRPAATRDYLLITVKNDGIGGGFVHDGKPLRGPVGEIGHYPVDTRAVLDNDMTLIKHGDVGPALHCSCGHFGCLEAYGTPNAVRRALGQNFNGATIQRLA